MEWSCRELIWSLHRYGAGIKEMLGLSFLLTLLEAVKLCSLGIRKETCNNGCMLAAFHSELCLYLAAESALAKLWSVAEGYHSPLTGLPARAVQGTQGGQTWGRKISFLHLLHVTRTPEWGKLWQAGRSLSFCFPLHLPHNYLSCCLPRPGLLSEVLKMSRHFLCSSV